MNIKELRINNFIIGNYTDSEKNEDKQELCKVVCLDSVGVTDNSIWVESKGSDIEKYNGFEGIELTEDNLLRLGVKRNDIKLPKKEIISFGITGGTPDIYVFKHFMPNVKHLHQVENLIADFKKPL